MSAAQRKRKRRIEAAAAGMTPKQHRIARAVASDVTAVLTDNSGGADAERSRRYARPMYHAQITNIGQMFEPPPRAALPRRVLSHLRRFLPLRRTR